MFKRFWRHCSFVLALVVIAGSISASPSTAATELRIMTWNALTQNGFWNHVTFHIEETFADVIGLQEVCEGFTDDIQNSLGDGWQVYYHHASTNLACIQLGSASASFGNAILVRPGIEVRDPIRVDYPPCNPQNDETRSFVAVTIVVNGRPVRVLSTHLGRDGDGSRCQIPLLAEYANSWTRGIILGDFNIRSTEPDRFTPLTNAGMVNGHPANYFTVANDPDDWTVEPTIKIDHIFHKGVKRLSRGTPDWNDQSDHRSLWADFTTN